MRLSAHIWHIVAVSVVLLHVRLSSCLVPFSEDDIYFIEKAERKPCTFFLGKETRLSRAEGGLVNCTWYKDAACCRRTEVTSVFSKIYPLNLASKKCRQMVNYMLCYWCSPLQYKWYYRKLFVCKEFCDALYAECSTATWKDTPIAEKYSTGTAFCLAQKFEVVPATHDTCFNYDALIFDSSPKMYRSLLALIICTTILPFFLSTSLLQFNFYF